MSILSLLRNEFNKFNNTEVRMFDYIYHMTLNYCEIIIVYFWCENVRICPYIRDVVKNEPFCNVTRKSINHRWFIDFNAWRCFTPRRDVI